MIYRDFQDLHLSLLGFGTMRLPTTVDGAIDEDTTQAMVDYALAHGVNYFDTAWAYMQNLSETVVGRCLKKHPRDSFYLATKYPGHTLTCDPDPADTFAQQLEKCRVDYFDFYLLHNVYENDVDIYTDPKWGIIDYFVEQKRLGRIKHLGFSTHADLPCLTAFLERYGKEMEFCQIQLNYLDWTIQRAKEKYELLEKHHIPVWVMEPVRGGKLAALDADSEQQLHVHMVLSGMSDMAQMADNVATFEHLDPLSPAEEAILFAAADKMKNSIPCTACRYCCDGCPQQLDIPDLLHKYNQLRTGSGSTIKMQLDAVPANKWPHACLGCGACAAVCPQKIVIPDELAAFAAELDKLPDWVEVCSRREGLLLFTPDISPRSVGTAPGSPGPGAAPHPAWRAYSGRGGRRRSRTRRYWSSGPRYAPGPSAGRTRQSPPRCCTGLAASAGYVGYAAAPSDRR